MSWFRRHPSTYIGEIFPPIFFKGVQKKRGRKKKKTKKKKKKKCSFNLQSWDQARTVKKNVRHIFVLLTHFCFAEFTLLKGRKMIRIVIFIIIIIIITSANPKEIYFQLNVIVLLLLLTSLIFMKLIANIKQLTQWKLWLNTAKLWLNESSDPLRALTRDS